ncbi:MAG: DUF192 domain-containing protein [Magnetospirillum gryphiswaldense]|nr:DUF192 domain-containing protein [Magnetospirillum gryphiswaldense]
MIKSSRILLTLLALLMCLPFGGAWAQVGFPKSALQVEGGDGVRHPFTVEVATDSDQLAQGLMYRKRMAADAGMLFDFGAPRPVSMWMKNTLIPLDMLFIAADGKVVGIAQRTVPHSQTLIESPGPVKGVLELNGGTVARLGLKVGDRVVHPLFGGT